MSKTLKWGGIGVGVLVLIIVALVLFVFSNLNSIVKAAVEEVGAQVTGTQVQLDDVDIELSSGKGALRGFRMTNPQGFADDDAFKFEEISVDIDLSTITSDKVVISEIVIERPEITYELAGDDSNLEKIKRNTEANAGGSGSEPAASGTDEGTGKKFIIENVYLRNGTVSARASQLLDKKLTLDLPDVHLQDIGKDDGGASPAAVAQQMMDEMLGGITASLNSIDISGQLEGLAEGASAAAEEVQKQAEEVMEDVGGAASDATDAASDAADEAGETIKNLFQ